MKMLIYIALSSALFANSVFCIGAVYCDPDSDGKPICPMSSRGETYRNFWDPTRYWVCTGPGEPISQHCPSNTGFSGVTYKCVPWTEWQWVPPCGIEIN